MAPWTAQGTKTALFVSWFFFMRIFTLSHSDINLIILFMKSIFSRRAAQATLVLKPMEMRCPVHTGLKKKKKTSLNALRSARRPVAEQARQKSSVKFFFLNCYWSHISSNCQTNPSRAHQCCLSVLEKEEQSKAWVHASRGEVTFSSKMRNVAFSGFFLKSVCSTASGAVQLLCVVNHSHYTKLVCGRLLWLGRDETDPLSVTGSLVSYQTDVIYPRARPDSPVRCF